MCLEKRAPVRSQESMSHSETKPFVSIVVALKNELGFVEKCLASLLNQTYPGNRYEILIFDGMSDDGTTEYLQRMAAEHPMIKLFENKKEVAAAGWNQGFRMARGKYVVMMGGHTFVEKDFIEKNVSLLEANAHVPCTGGSVQAIGGDLKSRAIALAFNHPFGVGDARYRIAKKECLVETINYGMYRKTVVDEMGPINEQIKRGEDWEYNYRVVSRFGKMLFSPAVRAYYFARSDFKKLWRRQFDAGFYKWEIIRKYPGSLLLRHVVPFLFALAILLLPLLVLLGLDIGFFYGFWLSYILVNIGVSLYLSVKHDFRYLPYLMWAFFVMQFAYGLGFALGFIDLLFSLIKERVS